MEEKEQPSCSFEKCRERGDVLITVRTKLGSLRFLLCKKDAENFDLAKIAKGQVFLSY